MIDLAYTTAGALTGLVVGMTGVGGGALMTPILLLFFGVAPTTAIATDLWFAATTKVVGAWIHHDAGQVDWQVVRRLWAGSLPMALAVVLAGLNERRRELAVLRAVGAAPRHVLGLLTLEGLWVTGAGVLLGVLLAHAGMALATPWLQSSLGIRLQVGGVLPTQLALMGAVLLAGLLASLGPAWRAYRLSLADGLSPRV